MPAFATGQTRYRIMFTLSKCDKDFFPSKGLVLLYLYTSRRRFFCSKIELLYAKQISVIAREMPHKHTHVFKQKALGEIDRRKIQ